jgi:hypothetical protein
MILELDEICGAAPEEDVPDEGRRQEDPKPEYFQYRDEGCKHADSCLECPFIRCFYEVPKTRRRRRYEQRDTTIIKLYRTGKNTRQLAKRFKVTRRTIERVLKNLDPGESENK